MHKHSLSDLMQVEYNCHDGLDHVEVFRAFSAEQDGKRMDFLDFVNVPPGASIGLHRHGDNCEWYVITYGQGKMIFCGEEIRVKSGDVLKNPAFSEHALFNDSDDVISLIVFQFSGENKYE